METFSCFLIGSTGSNCTDSEVVIDKEHLCIEVFKVLLAPVEIRIRIRILSFIPMVTERHSTNSR